ncbi:MAG: DUF255 domain-containing protein [Haliscomenobacteraceae bacterium CHB4]|nr:Thiol:disulfide interchange protein DsbD [Saprospiraceae bacterium]MCE7924428.1 DUF255 domain-containing protein [Haliscomenobacteraceae bacterium CHB4]
MRKLIVICIIALLVGPASAQTAPRSNTQTGAAKTSLTPSAAGQRSNSSNSRSSTPSDIKAAKNSASNNAASRTSQLPAQSRSPQLQNTSSTTRTSTTRPSLNQNATGTTNTTTARNISNNVKKAPEVKVAVNPVRVKWMTLEEALEKSKTDKRKIFVDVYTDWCGWCKRMDSTTFMNPAVAQYLNEHYYPVKFNAEQQKDIVYKDKTYQFKKNGARGYHELAAAWLNNRLSYPTTVFLDENQGVIQPLPGYQDAAKMEAVLNYFGTDSHKKTPWESYQKNFNNSGTGQ